jgi:hypothetical protein
MKIIEKSHVQEIAIIFIRRAGVNIGGIPIPKHNGALRRNGASFDMNGRRHQSQHWEKPEATDAARDL